MSRTNGITAAEKLACAERELRLRRRNYVRYLATGRISLSRASYELKCMAAICEDLRAAAERERLL